MKQACLLSALLLMSACATTPREIALREYQRGSARVEALEKFAALKIACEHAGGTVQVKRMSSGRMRPTTTELRAATCARHPASVLF